MRPIVKEPFAPRRRNLTGGFRRFSLWFFCRQLLTAIYRRCSFGQANGEDVCMIVVLIALSVITLLLPWMLL